MTTVIPLHQNESYWLLDAELCGSIECVTDESILSRYPEYAPLRAALAAYAEVDQNQIVLTPGSDAAIAAITELCVRKGLSIVLPVPTFYGYERILERYRATVIPTFYEEVDGEFRFPLDATLAALKSGTSLFLCHPNNPLGCTIPETDLVRLLDTARDAHVLVVLDEAYLEFGGTTHKDRIDRQEMFVVRTLSKAFGLSGARVGYTMSSRSLAQELGSLLLPWPIAHASADAACRLLAFKDRVAERRALVIKERDVFVKELSQIAGITAYPSATNFVLIRSDFAAEIAAELENEGFKVATTGFMSGFPLAKDLLRGTLRISVPDPTHRDRVLSVLRSMDLQSRAHMV